MLPIVFRLNFKYKQSVTYKMRLFKRKDVWTKWVRSLWAMWVNYGLQSRLQYSIMGMCTMFEIVSVVSTKQNKTKTRSLVDNYENTIFWKSLSLKYRNRTFLQMQINFFSSFNLLSIYNQHLIELKFIIKKKN